MWVLWGYPGEEGNKYTHLWLVLFSGSIKFTPVWVRQMSAHYTQAKICVVVC